MYGKLYASIFQGTLRGQAHPLLVFMNMIACADRHGVVDKHPRAIADEVGLTLEEVKEAIEYLMAPDLESRSTEEEGRRLALISDTRTWGWRIVNYPKYRAIRNEEERRESVRKATARWRAKGSEPDTAEDDHGEHVIQCDPPVIHGDPSVIHGDPMQMQMQKKMQKEKTPPYPPVPGGNGSKRAADLDEIEWRVQETWKALIMQRSAYMKSTRGADTGRAPTMTKDIARDIRECLREYDSDLLGPLKRSEWKRESKTRGAAIGMYLDPFLTGKDKDSDREYLDAWRPWRLQRGKGRPTERLAQLYFDARADREAQAGVRR